MLSSYSISDDETRETIKNLFEKENYFADPHGAVAYTGLNSYLLENPNQKGIFLETAHPVKFYEIVGAQPTAEVTPKLLGLFCAYPMPRGRRIPHA